MERSPEQDKYIEAILAVQNELRGIDKDADNPFFKSKYASLPVVCEMLRPVLNKHGLILQHFPDNIDGEPAMTIDISHVSGQYRCSTFRLSPVKNDPQGIEAASTYGRRTSAMSALFMPALDDDGNEASAPAPQPRKAEPKPAVKKPGGNAAAIKQMKQELNKCLEAHGFTEAKDKLAYIQQSVGHTDELTVNEMAQLMDQLQAEERLAAINEFDGATGTKGQE